MEKHILFKCDPVLGLWSRCTAAHFKGINKQNCLWVEGIDEDTNILRVVACSRWLHFHVGIADAAEERHAACGQSSPRSSCRRQSVFLFFFFLSARQRVKKKNCCCLQAFFFYFFFPSRWCMEGKKEVPTAKWFHMTSAVIVIWISLKILFENSRPVGVCLNGSQGCPISVTCVKCTLTYTHTSAFAAKQLPGSDVAIFADDHNISSQFKRPTQKRRQMCRLDDTGGG